MNILIDAIPDTVDILGKSYKINTDFRNSILFEQLIQDRDIKGKMKMANAINLYFDILPEGINTTDGVNETLKAILWFYSLGKTKDEGQEQKASIDTKPILCWDNDARFIYSAFKSQYGIDLQDDILHWWKFKALFSGLNEDNKIVKIMSYRSIKIDNKMSKEQKKFYREMKKIYKIPDKRTPEEIEKDFTNNMDSMF